MFGFASAPDHLHEARVKSELLGYKKIIADLGFRDALIFRPFTNRQIKLLGTVRNTRINSLLCLQRQGKYYTLFFVYFV